MEKQCYEVQMISNKKGRGLISTRSIRKGEVILTEKPLVCSQFAWNGDPIYPYSACDHCLAPLDTAETNVRRLLNNPEINLPFPECCHVKKELVTECDACTTRYCSTECKNEAWQKYHRTICVQSKHNFDMHPLSILIETWKNTHHPPETCSIMLIVKMVALLKQNPNFIDVMSDFCNKVINDEEAIKHYLLKEKFEKHIDDLRELTMKAINVDHVPQWFTPEGFRSLLALIGTNGQGIGTSSFGQWVKNVYDMKFDDESQKADIEKYIDNLYNQLDEVVGTFLNNEGSGIYAIQSKINHSCSPNAAVEFPYSNNILVIKATKDISENEEIYISYIDECSLERSRHSRQKLLKDMYLFHCDCEKCISEADDPDVTSDSESENSDSEIEY